MIGRAALVVRRSLAEECLIFPPATSRQSPANQGPGAKGRSSSRELQPLTPGPWPAALQVDEADGKIRQGEHVRGRTTNGVP
jgi:hypothetical protein